MRIVVRVTIEDDKAPVPPVKNQILSILILLSGSAKKTSRLFLTQDELLTPGCPQLFQARLLEFLFSRLLQIYNKTLRFSRFLSHGNLKNCFQGGYNKVWDLKKRESPAKRDRSLSRFIGTSLRQAFPLQNTFSTVPRGEKK